MNRRSLLLAGLTVVGAAGAVGWFALPDGTRPLTIAAASAELTKLKGAIQLVDAGALPNDGKIIADERPVG